MNTNQIAITLMIGSLILLTFVFFILLFAVEHKRKQVRNAREKEALKHQYRNEVLQTKLEVQEQTFRYVSEEIHDNIAQNMSLVKMKLFRAADKIEDIALSESLLRTTELLGDSLNDLRNLSHVLNGNLMAKLDLKECIEKEIQKYNDVDGLQLKLSVTGSRFEPDAEKKILIFRVIQEAINNAIKHGKAERIDIVLSHHHGIFTIKIMDDGKGFDLQIASANGGLGLLNINTRAQLLGAIKIESTAGSGTCITLIINTDGKDKTGVSR